MFHVRIEVIVFSLLLVVVFLTTVAFPRVRSERLVYIQAVVMVVLAEEGIWVVYKSSITAIIKPEEQLHHLTHLPAYLTIRVHLQLPQRLNPATRFKEVPDRPFTLQSHGFIILEEAEKCE